MQPCVTKPVLLESVCSMRPGHTGFLPTSSLPSSPFRECTPQPVGKTKKSTEANINKNTRLGYINTKTLFGDGNLATAGISEPHLWYENISSNYKRYRFLFSSALCSHIESVARSHRSAFSLDKANKQHQLIQDCVLPKKQKQMKYYQHRNSHFLP